MPLKAKKKVVFEVDYGDFERFVKETYGKDYSFVASRECGNDTSHSFNNVQQEPLDEWAQVDLDEFKNNDSECLSPHTILNDLVNRDLIEPGNYVVRVSW